MLSSLHITNYAIVEQLALDFSQAMTAFTGETGAGKSIMIDALSLALGERADSSVVRPGCDKCQITALFQIDNPSPLSRWLLEHEIDNPDNQVILSRIITAEGRSKALVNGQIVPLHLVRELSQQLVNIHGQHQNQDLLSHQTHRKQLDNFGHHEHLLHSVQQQFKTHQDLLKRITHLKNQQINDDRIELLRYQIDELTELELSKDELERLNQEHQRLHHAQHYLTSLSHSLELLQDNEQGNIQQSLNQVLHLLSELPDDDSLKAGREMLNTALIHCQEAIAELKQFESSVSIDPERLNQVEQRLQAIHDMARKHHVDASQLNAHYSRLQQELNDLTQASHLIETLTQQLNATEQEYYALCQKLTIARQKSAKKLSRDITNCIRQLGMPQGSITLKITPFEKMHPHGMDRVEYLVCTNPGQPLDALSKIASGGELSRISLAIQVITAQKASTPTLLFDEVDVGIGGATAAMVGRLLRQLSQRLQVFCVTHQAQVASCAHHHLMVSKHNKAQKTFSNIKALTSDERIEEIARMLGGLSITTSTRIHAKELLTEYSG